MHINSLKIFTKPKILFIFWCLIHLVIIAKLELLHDEAYYWSFTQNLSFGYFDHPPMVAWVIGLFSWISPSAFMVRLGFLALFIILSWFYFFMEDKDENSKISWWLSFPLISSVPLLALPDLPLLCGTFLFFILIKRYLNQDKNYLVLLLIATITFLFYSKYHSILILIFTLLAHPQFFKRKSFWIIVIGVTVLYFPHLWWQIENDFITFRYHFLERPKSNFSIKRLMDYWIIQSLFLGGVVGPYLVYKLTRFKSQNPYQRILVFNTIGILLFFFISSFSKKVEANWTLSASVSMFLLCTYFNLSRFVSKVFIAQFFLIIFFKMILVFSPKTLELKRLQEVSGWDEWSQKIRVQCRSPLLANTYQVASKYWFYTQTPTASLNLHSRKNHFDLLAWIDWYPSKEVCFISDLEYLGGQEVTTPDGKRLFLLDNYPLDDLIRLKEKYVKTLQP